MVDTVCLSHVSDSKCRIIFSSVSRFVFVMERASGCVVVCEFIYTPLFRWNFGLQSINVFLIGSIHAIMHPTM